MFQDGCWLSALALAHWPSFLSYKNIKIQVYNMYTCLYGLYVNLDHVPGVSCFLSSPWVPSRSSRTNPRPDRLHNHRYVEALSPVISLRALIHLRTPRLEADCSTAGADFFFFFFLFRNFGPPSDTHSGNSANRNLRIKTLILVCKTGGESILLF